MPFNASECNFIVYPHANKGVVLGAALSRLFDLSPAGLDHVTDFGRSPMHFTVCCEVARALEMYGYAEYLVINAVVFLNGLEDPSMPAS